MIRAFGSKWTFATDGAVCLVTSWFIRVFMRETKSLEPERISAAAPAA